MLGGDHSPYSGTGALGGGRRQRGGNGGDANGTDANNAEAQAVEPQNQAGSSLGTSPVGTYLPAAKSPASKGGSRKKKHYRHPKKGQASRTRKGRQAFVTHKGDKDYNARRHRQKKKHKPYTRRKRRTKQRGGYAQWMSNIPSTPGFASPNPGPLPWATGPLSHTRQINCNNNYDHFTGKNNPSGVYDKAAPPTPFGGTAGTKK